MRPKALTFINDVVFALRTYTVSQSSPEKSQSVCIPTNHISPQVVNQGSTNARNKISIKIEFLPPPDWLKKWRALIYQFNILTQISWDLTT